MPKGIDPLSLSGWLMRGAIREDDAKGEKNPQDDILNPDLRRPLHHFFDPYYNRPLDVLGLTLIDNDVHRALDWAVGSRNAFNDPNTPETGRRNHFTVFDAREAMYRALTGKKLDSTNATPNASDNNPAPEHVRKTYWATTFRALGDILHLNQDMAQPQHTRNEPHTGKGVWLVDELLTGHESVLEKYIDARATGDKDYKLDGQPITPAPLVYDTSPSYPVPAFSKYSDYWSTSPGGYDSVTGQGLADYSSRGFYTPKYNYGNGVYPYPAGGTLENVTLSDGSIQKFLRVMVTDQYPGGTSESILMASRSAWDDILENFGFNPTYTLTKTNYDQMASLLIPRAVAYSAGLINHFFRGQMKIELPDEGVYGLVDHSAIQIADPLTNYTGFDKIKLKLSNTTPNGEAMTGGRVVAAIKFRRNTCYKDDLTGYPPFVDGSTCRTEEEEIVVSDPLNGGGSIALSSTAQPFEFAFPKGLPINATDVRLQVVYRGTLGEEADAVVVTTQDLSEPTFFSYINASDYIRLNGYVYTRDQINANQTLLSQVRPQSCVDSTTMQLKPSCLNPFGVNLGLSIGGNGKQTQIDVQLPLRRFMRIAFLSDATAGITISQKDTNNCYPHTAFEPSTLEWQDYVDPSTSEITMKYPSFKKIRDVPDQYVTSCIVFADDAPIDSPDNRNEVMTPIDTSPYALQINSGTGF